MSVKKEHLDKGRLFSAQGKIEEAINEYKEALKIDPHYKKARVNLNLLYYMKGEMKTDGGKGKTSVFGRGIKKGKR